MEIKVKDIFTKKKRSKIPIKSINQLGATVRAKLEESMRKIFKLRY